MASYIVSGAGTTTCNGTYEEAGTHNGKPYYSNGTVYLFWTPGETGGAGWVLYTSLHSYDSTFSYYCTGTTLPGALWYVGMEGTPPAPTVSGWRILDVIKSAAQTGIDGVTLADGARVVGNTLDRGKDTAVGPVTGLLTVTGFAAAPAASGYMAVRLCPLSASGDVLYDDGIGAAVVPVSGTARHDAAVQLSWPPGCRYAKAIVGNKSGQATATDAVSLELRWQAVTV